jgi:tetratricopeptide (TPR) repeat protein
MEKPKFSCVLITRNEAKYLPRMLASLKPFMERGGECVIVDTGSTDNTAQIARDAGCKVEEVGDRFRITIDEPTAKAINERFIVKDEPAVVNAGDSLFDFASARNYATSLASNDFIAMHDADEVYTNLDIDVIDQHIRNGIEQFEYNFIFSHDVLGNPAIQFIQSKCYDRRKMRWEGVVHEVLQGSANRVLLPKEVVLLEHYQNVETPRGGYLKGLALDCFQNPDKDRQSHYFAREMLYTGRLNSAIKEFERHVAMNRWPAEKAQSVIFIGECYDRLGFPNMAVSAWQESFNIEAGRREALIRLMEHYYHRGDARRVVAYGEAALTIPQSGFYADNAAHYREWPHEMLYWAYWQLGDKDKSYKHWRICWDYNPEHPKYSVDAQFYWDNLFVPHITVVIPTLGRPDGLERCLKSIEAQNYPQDKIFIQPIEGEATVPEKVEIGVRNMRGSHVIYAANDMEFDKNAFLIATQEIVKESKRLIAFSSGPLLPDKGNICEHFLISRGLVDKLEKGQIFSTDFHHVGCDNWLWAQADKMGEAFHSERAKVTHHHFSKGAEYDSVYAKGWGHVEQDRATLKSKLDSLYASPLGPIASD